MHAVFALLVTTSAFLLNDQAGPLRTDPFEIRHVVHLPYFAPCRYVCGDADHDGFREFYGLGKNGGTEWVDYALEYRDSAAYVPTRLGWVQVQNWALGDADRDGRSDLLVAEGRRFCLFESQDMHSLPSRLVFIDTFAETPHVAMLADLDSDSASEVVAGAGTRADIHIAENAGPDTYILRTRLQPRGGIACDFVQTDDLDHDGLRELVVGTDATWMETFECRGNDSFVSVQRWKLDSVNSSCIVNAVAAAPDMDRDGKPEVIAFGVEWNGNGTLAVFESVADDSLLPSWKVCFPASYGSLHELAVGDLTGDGVPEFAVTDGMDVRLYRCTGNDQYELFWQTYSGQSEVGLYDIDSDGRAELLYRYSESTFVCKYVSLGVEEQVRRRLNQVAARASLVRRGEVVRLSAEGLSQAEVAVNAEVLDVAGRIVADLGDCRGGAGWQTTSVQPGAYFVRISSGSLSVTRKVVVAN